MLDPPASPSSLLAIAMIAVVGLTVAVVILAVNDSGGTGASSPQPLTAPARTAPGEPQGER